MKELNLVVKSVIAETLSTAQKECIFQLWNNGYPSALFFNQFNELEKYLQGLNHAHHYFIELNGVNAWAMVFERDHAVWFALIVDANLQKKGVGKYLLNQLKAEHSLLNGWVIDKDLYRLKNGEAYHSPLGFYLKHGFDCLDESRLELPNLSAVKVQWHEKENNYLFTSPNLGFRKWRDSDLKAMAQISSDKDVMEFFPGIQNRLYVFDFIQRMKSEYVQRRHCYFAVDLLETSEMIGFIGLHEQNFESDFTPCTDIGWRLKKDKWNKGYATEGAKRCLLYAFDDLKLERVYSMTPRVNLKSQRIMEKIGMKKEKYFVLEFLKEDVRLRDCVLYAIQKTPVSE
ncbi:MAG: GNAT family N-acetyltransferase [Bacteroidota bacterium]